MFSGRLIIFVSDYKNNYFAMAGIVYLIRPGKKDQAPVYIKVRHGGKDYLHRIPETYSEPDEWPEGKNAQIIIRRLFPQLETIYNAVTDSMNKGTFDAETLDSIIEGAIYADAREKATAKIKKAQEERKKLQVLDYFAVFIDELQRGVRKSAKGTQVSDRTLVNYRQGYNRLMEFQKSTGKVITWADIDRDFVGRYIQFLQSSKRGDDAYNTNTCAKRVKELKHLIRAAREDGVTDVQALDYKFGEVAVDSVYLSWDEIKRFADADLSRLKKSYETARDLFLIGCYSGQRISDFAHITSDQIETDEDGRMYLTVLQRKTGTKVVIPCRKELRAILEKYDYQPPTLCDQMINRCIKTIAQRAGINEVIEYTSTKGGKKHTVKAPKYELITGHTARRSAATLMYLQGLDSMDIRTITGHSSDKMLQKYIKSTAHDNARMMAKKSSYWD